MARSNWTIRPAGRRDLQAVLDIYAAARAFMASHGNPSQWGGGYPSRALVEEDIALGRSYVAQLEGRVRGVFMFSLGPDPTYAVIEDGAWPDDGPYGVIHRIAGDGQGRGLVAAAVDFCQSRCEALRIDTHHDNHVMQRALEKCGFVRCGIIYTDDGTPRIAYHRPAQRT